MRSVIRDHVSRWMSRNVRKCAVFGVSVRVVSCNIVWRRGRGGMWVWLYGGGKVMGYEGMRA